MGTSSNYSISGEFGFGGLGLIGILIGFSFVYLVGVFLINVFSDYKNERTERRQEINFAQKHKVIPPDDAQRGPQGYQVSY